MYSPVALHQLLMKMCVLTRFRKLLSIYYLHRRNNSPHTTLKPRTTFYILLTPAKSFSTHCSQTYNHFLYTTYTGEIILHTLLSNLEPLSICYLHRRNHSPHTTLKPRTTFYILLTQAKSFSPHYSQT